MLPQVLAKVAASRPVLFNLFERFAARVLQAAEISGGRAM
jgi:hypothetical protein